MVKPPNWPKASTAELATYQQQAEKVIGNLRDSRAAMDLPPGKDGS